MFKNAIAFFFIYTLLNSCNGQSEKIENCKLHSKTQEFY